MLKEKQLFGTVDKVDLAIKRLKEFEPSEGYYLAFSGGKDSVTLKRLADMSGVKYDAHYNVTTIDPPELVYFIRDVHPDVERNRPKVPFLKRMVKKGFPLRRARWCCDEYKEGGGVGRIILTGIRWEESSKRAGRKMVEQCLRHTAKLYVHPIIDWTSKDVWDFIRAENIPYCNLYDKGFKRLGCLMCPMATVRERQREMELYPGYEKQFRKAFRRLYQRRKAAGSTVVDRWSDGDAMFEWWMAGEGFDKENPDQRVMFE